MLHYIDAVRGLGSDHNTIMVPTPSSTAQLISRLPTLNKRAIAGGIYDIANGQYVTLTHWGSSEVYRALGARQPQRLVWLLMSSGFLYSFEK
jgi:hypothetical protein